MPFNPTAYKTEFNRQKYDEIKIRVPKGNREEIAKAAANRGMSLNQYIISLIEEDIQMSNARIVEIDEVNDADGYRVIPIFEHVN